VTPIFLIVGAPAVGKSTTAHALAAQYPKSIHIPVDNLRDLVVAGRAYPGNTWSPELVEQLKLARESTAQMAISYSNAGFAVTIDDFWDSNSRLLEYQAVFQDSRTRKILLYPNQLTAQERNQKRSGPGNGNAYIAAGIQAVYERLNSAIPDLQQQGWMVIDTTDQDVETTVKYILAKTG
jgi:predicted kinase